MYDELVKRLREEAACPDNYAEDSLIMREAADAIEELSMKLHGDEAAIVGMKREIERMVVSAKPQWIPVTERLPDIGEHYVSEPCLCYCSNGAYCFGALEENIFGASGWNCERDDDYHKAVGEVVAWMPLPQPPKEET